MKTMPIKARLRTEAERGTRACKKLRRSGELPANLYGPREEGGRTVVDTWNLAVSAWDVTQVVSHRATIIEVRLGKDKKLALVKHIQRDGLGDDLMHIDLAVIDAKKPVEVAVPLAFKGDAKGKKEGGRVLPELRQLLVKALPTAIPEEILVRIDDLGLNEAIHVKELKLPEGVTTDVDPDQLVVHCLPLQVEAEAAPAAAEGTPAEPEVIGRKKEEGEEGAEAAAE